MVNVGGSRDGSGLKSNNCYTIKLLVSDGNLLKLAVAAFLVVEIHVIAKISPGRNILL